MKKSMEGGIKVNENKIFEIPLNLPSLKDYTKVYKTNKILANKMLYDIEQQIKNSLKEMPNWSKHIKIYFTWVKNKNKNLDVGFAKKIILDTMVKCGKLNEDNRNSVYSFIDSFTYNFGGENKVILEVEED